MRDNDGGGPGGGAGAENRDVSPVRLADTRNGGRTCELGGGIQQLLETVGRSVRQRETVSMPVKRDLPVDEPGEAVVSELDGVTEDQLRQERDRIAKQRKKNR